MGPIREVGLEGELCNDCPLSQSAGLVPLADRRARRMRTRRSAVRSSWSADLLVRIARPSCVAKRWSRAGRRPARPANADREVRGPVTLERGPPGPHRTTVLRREALVSCRSPSTARTTSGSPSWKIRRAPSAAHSLLVLIEPALEFLQQARGWPDPGADVDLGH